MQPSTEERWYVNVGKDDVKMMTLDELVEAFEGGVITKDTLVVEVGGNEWQPLSEVADLGDDDGDAPAAAPQPAAAQPVAAAAQASWPPVAVSRAPESAWPPVVSRAPAPAAASVPPSAPLSSLSMSAPQSTIPVGYDLDLDMGAASFKSGKRNLVIAGAALVAVLGAGGFALTRSGGPQASPVPAAAPLAAADPTPYSSPATETAPVAEPKDEGDRLSDEQKAALAAADKERETKRAARPRGPAQRSGGSNSGSGSVFKATGNADDPLNPSL